MIKQIFCVFSTNDYLPVVTEGSKKGRLRTVEVEMTDSASVVSSSVSTIIYLH